MRYGKWPHEVAALPFHYFLALREDWITAHTVVAAVSDDDEDDAETIEIE